MHKTNTTQTDKTYLTETRNIVTEICVVSPNKSLSKEAGWHQKSLALGVLSHL